MTISGIYCLLAKCDIFVFKDQEKELHEQTYLNTLSFKKLNVYTSQTIYKSRILTPNPQHIA